MIAVDFGNTRAKFGIFLQNVRNNDHKGILPIPDSVLAIDSPDIEALIGWLHGSAEQPLEWYVARTGTFLWDEFQAAVVRVRPQDRFEEMACQQIPIPVDVEFPDKVGVDRLLAVYAASCWRTLNTPRLRFDKQTRVLVVDAGSAVTVDLLAGEGYFAGGAILPGLNAVAESLAKISSKLPRVSTGDISFAVYPGKNTEEAVIAGIYWGVIGAVRQFHQLVQTSLQDAGLPDRVPVILTGGDAQCLQAGLSLFMKPENIFLFPDIVLTGIALAVQNRAVHFS